MTQHQCSEDQFLKDASRHVMTVLREDGIHRHIRFRRPGDSAYWFDLITWPGTLCIDGDMGTYVFRRLDDMFEFFRTDRKWAEARGHRLGINPSYWSEKLQAPKSRDAEEFSADRFRQRVKEAFDEWVANHQPDDDDSTTQAQRDEFAQTSSDLWEELEDQVLCAADDGDVRSYDAAHGCGSSVAKDFDLRDCWEWRCREFTFHFIWCCYAIAWGIKTYDDARMAIKEAA